MSVLICLSVAIVGASYGVTAGSAGFSLWQLLALAVLVLGASSEFLFIGIIAAGGGAVAAVIAGLLINSRNFAYGLAAGSFLGEARHTDSGWRRGSGWRKLVGAHLVNDESVAVAMAQESVERKRAAFWFCGIGIAVSWPIGALLGGLLGRVVRDPRRVGIGCRVSGCHSGPCLACAEGKGDIACRCDRCSSRGGHVAVPAVGYRSARCAAEYRGDDTVPGEGSMNTASVWIGIVVFACGSYALRASGVLLRARVKLSGFAEKTLDRAVVVLLLAVVVTSTVFTGHDVAGPARMLGVVAGGICAWFKAPLVVVVIVAAGTTAVLRLSGVS